MPDLPKRSLARSFRRRPTSVERMLWKVLRDRRIASLKFRRQVPLGRYIVDFICFRHRLIVEADGPWHDPEQDRVRDAWLSGQGFSVLRFSNGAIAFRQHEVIAAIVAAVTPPAERRVNPSSDLASRGHLLPQGEKGDFVCSRRRKILALIIRNPVGCDPMSAFAVPLAFRLALYANARRDVTARRGRRAGRWSRAGRPRRPGRSREGRPPRPRGSAQDRAPRSRHERGCGRSAW